MNDQEKHWKGKAGDEYHQRSPGDEESNYHFFRLALACSDLRWNCSVIEFGCGTGANLRAIKRLYASPQMTGVEINPDALAKIPTDARMVRASVLDWRPDDEWELAITKGLLIHIAPADLPKAYKTIVDATNRYLLVAEYFCQAPRMIPYRGLADRLWARDFAGEIMDQHGLKLIDYGFVSKRDRHPQDDLTYFLMEKP